MIEHKRRGLQTVPALSQHYSSEPVSFSNQVSVRHSQSMLVIGDRIVLACLIFSMAG
jgi:hypothetical protein